MRLEHLLNDIDRGTLNKPFRGNPLAVHAQAEGAS